MAHVQFVYFVIIFPKIMDIPFTGMRRIVEPIKSERADHCHPTQCEKTPNKHTQLITGEFP